MSTKDLARTIIEGGRASYSRWQRAQSHRDERTLTRAYLIDAAQFDDGFDRLAIGKRDKVYRGFADKLSAPRRWLRSQVGRPWDKVRAELFERFDPRTLAGRHIIFCHMLPDVRMAWEPTEAWRTRREQLLVDVRGILRLRPAAPRPSKDPGIRLRPTRLAELMAERRVGGSAHALFWFVIARRCHDGECSCPRVGGKVAYGAHLHYRQDRRLTVAELEFWNGLCQKHRDEYWQKTGVDSW